MAICAYEDELICDFAETYHIFDYKALSPSKAAVLFCGLRENSRVMMAASERKFNQSETLLASIADRLAIVIWQRSEDGANGRNFPKLILGGGKKNETYRSFDSAEDFDAEWKRLTER